MSVYTACIAFVASFVVVFFSSQYIFSTQKIFGYEQKLVVAIEEVHVDATVTRARKNEPTFVANDSGDWQMVASSTAWVPRDSSATFVFKDKMWIMGGLNGNNVPSNNHKPEYWKADFFNDIWSSEDGATWTREVEHAEWSPRRSMSVVEYGGELWMFGGWSQKTGYEVGVWKSSDGIQWKQVLKDAPWGIREGQSVEVFLGKMWLFGGVNYDDRVVMNDVWYSENGIDWTFATTAPMAGRWDQATAVFNDTLFLTGGMNLTGTSFGDEWYTKDGIHWEEVIDVPWEARQGHALVPLAERLWLVGRLNDSKDKGVNDVWYSEDGFSWSKTKNDPAWVGREDGAVLPYRGDLVLFGGMGSDWVWKNDVWKMSGRVSDDR